MRSSVEEIQRRHYAVDTSYNELRTYRKFNLTLTQLWPEYKENHPDGYQYTQSPSGYSNCETLRNTSLLIVGEGL
jgi:hypothetical protein